MMAEKGEEAVGNYVVATGEMNIHNHINEITNQIASGGRKGIYAPGSKLMTHLGELGDVVEKQGSEAGLAFAKANFTAERLGEDVSMLPKEIGSRIRGAISSGANGASGKAAKALGIVKAMDVAGARTGVMSKKTLLNVIKSGKAALRVVHKTSSIPMDFM
jgi:hypothetical protein